MVEEKPLYAGRSFMTDEQRAAILDELPMHGNVLEIGTGHGVTVAWWAHRRPRVTFLSVDTFTAGIGTGPGVIDDWRANRQPNQHLFVGSMPEMLGYKCALRFDLAFVDGGHSYRDCMTDMECAVALLTRGGRLLIHDYGRRDVAQLRGVSNAVDDFCQRGKPLSTWHQTKTIIHTAVLERKA